MFVLGNSGVLSCKHSSKIKIHVDENTRDFIKKKKIENLLRIDSAQNNY